MKTFVVLVLALLPSLAMADAAEKYELVETLIANSGKINLTGKAPRNMSMPQLLAQALAEETMIDIGKTVYIPSISSKCEFEGASIGGSDYTCSLFVDKTEYTRVGNGFQNPSGEVGYVFTFKTTKSSKVGEPGGRHNHQLKGNKVNVELLD